MAPTFRSSRSGRQFGETTNRSRTSAADHDIFEGLPIRRWTRQSHTVSQDPKSDSLPDNAAAGGGSNAVGGKSDQPFPELPMPKDSHLLAPQSRALLRAARAGYIYLLPASKDTHSVDERDGPDMEDANTPAVKNERSYTAKKWSQIPRHVELPEVEFLAKRRPGLPSLYGASGAVTAAVPNALQPMRKAKIRKVDPVTGNITIYDAWIPEGQKVEGEIKDETQASNGQTDVTVIKATPAPGTVVEGVGVANAEGIVVASAVVESPSKRKGPPPPKRKGKGLKGRGRKKVMFAPGDGAEAGGEERAAEGEQDEEDDDDEGEEGEDAEDGEEVAKEEQVTDTQMKGTAPDTAPEAALNPALNTAADTAPKLDLDATPSFPPAVETNMPPAAEPIVPEPQSPIRPQSEQLTPPDEPVSEAEQIELDKAPEPKSETVPDVDAMEDVQQTQPALEAPTLEKIEVIQTVQPAADDTETVETEIKVEQTVLEKDEPNRSQVAEEPLPAMTVPATQNEVPESVQESPAKEPSQPVEETSQPKIEQSPAVEPLTENETKPEIEPVPEEPVVEEPVAEEQETVHEEAAPQQPAEGDTVNPPPVETEAPVDEKTGES